MVNTITQRPVYQLRYQVGTLAGDGWTVTFSTERRGLGMGAWLQPAQTPRRCTKCNSTSTTASVPITVLLYSDLLLWGSIVPVRGS